MLKAKCCEAVTIVLLSSPSRKGDDDVILAAFALEQVSVIKFYSA